MKMLPSASFSVVWLDTLSQPNHIHLSKVRAFFFELNGKSQSFMTIFLASRNHKSHLNDLEHFNLLVDSSSSSEILNIT